MNTAPAMKSNGLTRTIISNFEKPLDPEAKTEVCAGKVICMGSS